MTTTLQDSISSALEDFPRLGEADLDDLRRWLIGAVGGLFETEPEYSAGEYQHLTRMAAMVCRHEQVEDTGHVTNLRFVGDREAALELILARAASVYRAGDDTRAARAAALWVCLEDHAEVVTRG